MANLGKVLALFGAIFAFSMVHGFASAPVWVLKNSTSEKKACVESVNRESPADLITINSGAESMLQIGAICSIFRDKNQVAKVVVVEANAAKAVAMVLTGDSVKRGDEVGIVLPK